jgi:hypothetical protein
MLLNTSMNKGGRTGFRPMTEFKAVGRKGRCPIHGKFLGETSHTFFEISW